MNKKICEGDDDDISFVVYVMDVSKIHAKFLKVGKILDNTPSEL